MPCNTPLPSMYVPKCVDERRVANFMKKKWPALTQLIGRPESTVLYYSAQDFTNLFIRMAAAPGQPFGVRMYFASYCLTGEPSVDAIVNAGYDKLLTIIFAPTDGNEANGFNDLGYYFVMSPNGGVFSISKNSANLLVLSYRDFKKPLLEAIISDAGIPNFQEGRAMWISMDAFTGPNGLIPEMVCQGASGVSLFFAAYGKDETSPSGVVVSWELTAVFILAKTVTVNGKSYIYYFDIEDIPGFSSRPPKVTPVPAPPPEVPQVSVQNSQNPDPVMRIQFDTINPCPPATNCGPLG